MILVLKPRYFVGKGWGFCFGRGPAPKGYKWQFSTGGVGWSLVPTR